MQFFDYQPKSFKTKTIKYNVVQLLIMFHTQERLLQASPQDAHISLMPYLWTVVIDLAIFFAKYKYTKYGVVVHGFIALFVSLSTMATAFPILIQEGIPAEEDESYTQGCHRLYLVINNDYNDITQRLKRERFCYKQVGLCEYSYSQVETQRKDAISNRGTLLSELSLQLLSLLKFYQAASQKCYKSLVGPPALLFIYILNIAHKYLGYALLLLCKIQVFLILNLDPKQTTLFWGLIGAQIAFFLLWLPRNFFFPTMQQRILPSYTYKDFKQIKSLRELQQAKNKQSFGVFANYVYNIQALKTNHPAGYHIINTIGNRDFDRYIYGMYRSEKEPIVPANSHSFKALDLVGSPIAKISIAPTYTGFDTELIDVTVSRIVRMSENGSIYEVYFKADNLNGFEYLGYSSLQQLGRFYSLTIDNKVTRLYTTVGFLVESNVNYLDKVFFAPNYISIKSREMKNYYTDLQLTERRGLKPGNELCILMKKYSQGKLTSNFIDNIPNSIQLSAPRGQGMRMSQIKQGNIILVAGGTGLYPFSDLIDLLFKSWLIFNRNELKGQIIETNPVLASDPFKHISFTLYLSVNHIEDIHPLTFAQLNQLSKNENSLKLYLRVSKKTTELQKAMNSKVVFLQQRFSGMLEQVVQKQSFEKILVCGPPSMNEEFIQLFDRLRLSAQKYLIM